LTPAGFEADEAVTGRVPDFLRRVAQAKAVYTVYRGGLKG
jgi:hypothetical protein